MVLSAVCLAGGGTGDWAVAGEAQGGVAGRSQRGADHRHPDGPAVARLHLLRDLRVMDELSGRHLQLLHNSSGMLACGYCVKSLPQESASNDVTETRASTGFSVLCVGDCCE